MSPRKSARSQHLKGTTAAIRRAAIGGKGWCTTPRGCPLQPPPPAQAHPWEQRGTRGPYSRTVRPRRSPRPVDSCSHSGPRQPCAGPPAAGSHRGSTAASLATAGSRLPFLRGTGQPQPVVAGHSGK